MQDIPIFCQLRDSVVRDAKTYFTYVMPVPHQAVKDAQVYFNGFAQRYTDFDKFKRMSEITREELKKY